MIITYKYNQNIIHKIMKAKETDPNGAWSEEFLKSQLDYWCSNSYHKLVGTKEVLVNSKIHGTLSCTMKFDSESKADIIYGYSDLKCTNCKVEGESYRLFSQKMPRNNDKLTINGEDYILGNLRGFIRYEIDVISMSDKEIVGTIIFEDYYKD